MQRPDVRLDLRSLDRRVSILERSTTSTPEAPRSTRTPPPVLSWTLTAGSNPRAPYAVPLGCSVVIPGHRGTNYGSISMTVPYLVGDSDSHTLFVLDGLPGPAELPGTVVVTYSVFVVNLAGTSWWSGYSIGGTVAPNVEPTIDVAASVYESGDITVANPTDHRMVLTVPNGDCYACSVGIEVATDRAIFL